MSQQNLNPSDSNVAVEDKKLSVQDMVNFMDEEPEILNLEPEKKPEKKEEKKEEKEEKETKEEELTLEQQIEQELEEEQPLQEEDLDLVVPVRRKEILAKYPEIFKDFPYLQKAMYLSQQLSEIVPTVEDAKAAVDKAAALDQYEEEILGGSTKSILQSIKDNDREAFNKVVDNYLPSLFQVDEAAFTHVVNNVISYTVGQMVQDSKADNDEDLGRAAEILNRYIFNSREYRPPQRLSKPENTENKKREDELSERESNLLTRAFETARDDISSRIDNVIKATVEANIDQKNSMSSYVKSIAIKNVVEGIDNLIERDAPFRRVFDRLWERAINDNFSKESMDKIKAAYLSKAKTLMPTLIAKERKEALKGLGKNIDENDNKDRKGPLPVGKTRGSASSPNSGKTAKADSKSIPKGMTTLQYLNLDD